MQTSISDMRQWGKQSSIDMRKKFYNSKTRACHKNIKELTNLSLKYVVIDNDSLINTNYIYA